jgi:hypothetical protein
MLVVFFNVVKVESVPLNSSEILSLCREPVDDPVHHGAGVLTCLVTILGADDVEGRFTHRAQQGQR